MDKTTRDFFKVVLIVLLSILLLGPNMVQAANPVWANQYSSMRLQSIKASSNGFVAAGSYCPYENYSCGYGQLILAKFDDVGGMVWSKSYPGAMINYRQRVTPKVSLFDVVDDGFIALGHRVTGYSPYQEFHGVQVMKLDTEGEVVWAKKYNGSIPGDGNYILALPDGYLVAGTRGEYDAADGMDAWVLKLDLSGNVLWEHTYGTSEGNENARIIQSLPDGYIVAGTQWSPEVEGNIWVMKLNPADGSVLWRKNYSSTGHSYISLDAMHSDSGGHVLAGYVRDAGWSLREAYTLHIDSSGHIQWQNHYRIHGDYPTFNTMRALDDGYIVAGGMKPSGSNDTLAWVMRLNTTGGIIWEKTIESSFENRSRWAKGIVQHEDGFVVVGEERDRAFMVRLKEDGDMSPCQLQGNAQAEIGPGNFQENTQATDFQLDQKPAIQAETVTVTATAFTPWVGVDCPPTYGPLGNTDRHCESILNRELCQLIRTGEFQLSVDGRYQTCIPACSLSNDIRVPEVSRDMMDVYIQMQQVLEKSHDKQIAPEFFKRLTPSLPKSASTPRREINKSLVELKGKTKVPPGLFEKLVEPANKMALALAVPKLSSVKVRKGQYTAVDLKGVAWLAFRDVKKSGRVSLKMVPGLPSKPKNYKAGWPITHYDFKFTGALARRGVVDVHLYVGGVNHAGPPASLRMLEWDGKSYKDITTNVDERRGIISGRTSKLSKLVVLSRIKDTSRR